MTGTSVDWENWAGFASVNLAATSVDPFVLVPGSPGVTWRIKQSEIDFVGLRAGRRVTGRAAVWFDDPLVSLVNTKGFELTASTPMFTAYTPPLIYDKASRSSGEAIMCGFTPDLGSGSPSGGRGFFKVVYEAVP